MKNPANVIPSLCKKFNNDRTRLMDVVLAVQSEFNCISDKSIDLIAKGLKMHRVEVESTMSFYAFLSKRPKGRIIIRVCNDIIDEMKGAHNIAKAFESALGIKMGETTKNGKFTLEWTPCIGMSDQAPAAMVNDVIVTNLTADKARKIVLQLKKKADPKALTVKYGDGNNANDLVKSMVNNNILKTGPVIFDAFESGVALRKAASMSPTDIIRDVKASRLRGRGGAGFPTGMKWDFTRQATGARKYVVCNADEGEPGTFKDRAILTECADLLFEGMTIAGYAIGSQTGILYLRAEYAYLAHFLNAVLEKRRRIHLLGNDIVGKEGFNFDIRIQLGAGAYICGEETSLLSSCEGLRGDPKTRPPFPAQKGYLGMPTVINNVETLCTVPRIINNGSAWFTQIGSKGSPGTKVLSISGDCKNPGVYEVPFGTKISEVLNMVGATDTLAVQMGGPSGTMVGTASFERTICYDDVATGGSVVVFGKNRDPLKVALNYMEFFCEESCGFCTPCRTGNMLLTSKLKDIIAGKGKTGDLEYMTELGSTVKTLSRCGLGQTSPNPILSTIREFRPQYEALLKKDDGYKPSFDIKQALSAGEEIAKRRSVNH